MQQIIKIYIIALFVIGSLFLVSAQKVLAGLATVEPIFCCLSENGCVDNRLLPPDAVIACQAGTIQENAVCNENTGSCVSLDTIHAAIPTVSEWGLIAMATILGIAGFMIIRRRKATA